MTPQQRRSYWILSGVLVLTWGGFLAYWLQSDRRPSNFSLDGRPNVFDVVLFVGLTFVLLMPSFMMTLGWIVTGLLQRKPTSQIPTTLPDPTATRVALITTYVPGSEPIDMLERTLRAMLVVDYPHDTWVLDEGNDTQVLSLCQDLGVKHFSRKGTKQYNKIGSKFSPKSKGGNHNAWYDAHGLEKYDIVAQIDTDFVPRADFLTKTLPYFLDTDVAFVGTPQIYGNMDNFVARGASEQTYGFYGPFLRGRILMIAVMPVFLAAFLSAIKDRNKHTEFEVTPKGGTSQLVTITKVKQRKNPYKAHMSVVGYAGTSLVVGALSGRLELSYLLWTIVTFGSVLAMVIDPRTSRVKQFMPWRARKQLAALNHDLQTLMATPAKVLPAPAE